MKIETDKAAIGQSLSVVRITHRGESLDWDVAKTYKGGGNKSNSDDGDALSSGLFDEINDYLATLSKSEQDRLWDVYRQCKHALTTGEDTASISARLRALVKEMYEIIDFDDLRNHVLKNIKFPYPSSVRETLSENYASRPADTTYIAEDFRGLVVLTIAFRPMVPIWGEFMQIATKDPPPNNREVQAFRLLRDSSIIQRPELMRLQRYVEAATEKTASSDRFIIPTLRGLGSAEVGIWLTAVVCVRRLPTAPILRATEKDHVIARVHFSLDNKMRSLDRDMGGIFGSKMNEKRSTGGGDENSSLVDAYKMKPDITDGDIAMLNEYARDPYKLLAIRCPDVPVEYLEASLKVARTVQHDEYDQTYLTKIVIHRALSHHAVDLLLIEPLRNCMAVAQACLWHWGFYGLAALVTSIPRQVEDGYFVGAAHETRARLLRTQMEAMEKIYVHSFATRKSAEPNVRQTNVAARATDRLAEILSSTDWELRAPPELIAKLDRRTNSVIYSVPPDIRINIGNLYLHPEISESE